MIIVDASAMTEFLLQTPLGSRVEARLLRDGDDFHTPHLLDVEVAQAFRRLVRAGDVRAARANEALDDLADFDSAVIPTSTFSVAFGDYETTLRRTTRCTSHSPRHSTPRW